MAGDAAAVIQQFWEIQDAGDYTALTRLFADDAILVDPFIGEIHGNVAVGQYMQKMNEQVGAQDGRFERIDVVTGGEAAWTSWNWITKDGTANGVTVYKIKDGKIAYYRDYMGSPPPGTAEE
jgi:steroid delta-isomerase